jgi:putative membrane-bound dehydrogenase-like protein
MALNARPLNPEESILAFQFESPDLQAELVAAEPQVIDPIAMCFDSNGDLYVVESPGYPHEGKGLPDARKGRIVRLSDLNGDGLLETRNVFARDLIFPNGILPWDGGFFVTSAPDILYLKDIDKDGQSDINKIVLTGFGTDSSSEQLRVACPTLGPDGWIYITSGLASAKVSSPLHPDRSPVEIRRNDGRFHPETLEFQPLPSYGQYGQAFDNNGRRFINSNRNPLQWCVWSHSGNKSQPSYPKPVIDLAEGRSRLYPLSPDTTASSFIPKLMQNLHAGTFTSACGLDFYDGKRLPRHRGTFFICEPAQNLVHCRFLRETATKFDSIPSAPDREFLASSDQWFRPVFATTGPDGALYLCDMYRKFIDHPNYLPKEASAMMDFNAGKQHGRIWRITSRSKSKPRPLPKAVGVSRAIKDVLDGDFTKGAERVGQIATDSGANEWFRAAILHVMGNRSHELSQHLGNRAAPELIEALAKNSGDAPITNPDWSNSQLFAFHLGRTDPIPESLMEKAFKSAHDTSLSVADRILAIRIAATDRPGTLLGLVDATEPQGVQNISIQLIGRKGDVEKLLTRHALLGPESRQILLSTILGNSHNHPAVLDAIETGQIPHHALTLNQRKRVQGNRKVEARARKLFHGPADEDRQKVFEAYRNLRDQTGKPSNGLHVYQRTCAQCHTFGNVGHKVGPDLTGLRNQPAEALLLHILDPNREVHAGFTLYEVETGDGQTFAGILSSETPDKITLTLPLGLRQTIQRSMIRRFQASNKSLMPDGLEQTMTRQEMMDLLAFLKN